MGPFESATALAGRKRRAKAHHKAPGPKNSHAAGSGTAVVGLATGLNVLLPIQKISAINVHLAIRVALRATRPYVGSKT